MKKYVWLLMLLCWSGVVLAEPLGPWPKLDTVQVKYTVQAGDNLWNLAGKKLDDPRLWGEIWKDNPFLQEDGRMFVKEGKMYVLIRPGEQLVGLEKLGILPTLTSLDSLGIEPAKEKVVVQETFPTWFGWLLLVVGLCIIAWALIRRMLNADPATARPAMVPGGVSEQSARTRFQESAARQHNAQGGTSVPAQQFVVLEQVVGRISGVLNVRYAGGREVPRRLDGERAFRALVRFPNGTVETLYMLQACGNDLRYGGISRYLPGPDFRFEEDALQVAQPAVTPIATNPTVAVPPGASTAREEEASAVGFVFKPANESQPAMLRLKGIDPDFSFLIGTDGVMTLRYRETPRRV